MKLIPSLVRKIPNPKKKIHPDVRFEISWRGVALGGDPKISMIILSGSSPLLAKLSSQTLKVEHF